jgi:hypothetical protein
LAGQAPHAAPLLPHSVVVCAAVTHPVLSQHPSGHEVALHATHAPLAQTRFVPQGLPSLMLLGAAHTGPVAHDIVPCWHGLPAGVHAAFGVHATHVPCPSQTPLATLLVLQEAPAAAMAFWSVHVIVPPAHEVTFPVWQGLAGGAHELPTWHGLQTPP